MINTKEYTRTDKVKRADRQYKKLVTKLNYNGRLVSIGNNFGRNMMCLCLSRKKFKHCCIEHHARNQHKQMQLQTAMSKLITRVTGYGFKLGRIGGRNGDKINIRRRKLYYEKGQVNS